MGNSSKKQNEAPSNPQPKGNNEVVLVASKMGPSGMTGFQAYHTSVEINGTEYFFDGGGIMSTNNRLSHQADPNNPQSRWGTTETVIGYTNKNGSDLKDALRKHFNSGTYDLLRKNCNCFSDCALYYLCKIRLDPGYRSLEQKGQSFPSIMTKMGYEPNPKAETYDHEAIILSLDPNRVFKQTKGHSLRGDGAKSDGKKLSAAEMRAKRLAAMGMS